jgi:hypothetical protein
VLEQLLVPIVPSALASLVMHRPLFQFRFFCCRFKPVIFLPHEISSSSSQVSNVVQAPASAQFVHAKVTVCSVGRFIKELRFWVQFLWGLCESLQEPFPVMLLSHRIKRLEDLWFKSLFHGDFLNALSRCSV